MYAIIDNNGEIHSSDNEEEMRDAFAGMTGDMAYFDSKKEYVKAVEDYYADWEGDLKLIEILKTVR